jgi:signal transduction histidine kinase
MKDLHIEHAIEEDVLISMNTKQLQRVIDNTISNAIKYSYEDAKIEISLHKEEDGVHLSFKDYGVGIENVDKIFQRYYREDTQKGGFGIGLNIVASIIKHYGILLRIDSTPKKGSIFTYIFPHAMVL